MMMMMMMNIQHVACVMSAAQLEMSVCVYSTEWVCAGLEAVQIEQSFKVQWLTVRWVMEKGSTDICGVGVCIRIYVPLPVCACLCLCCVKWNEQQRFRVAQGTWPSDWSDKGRAGQEGGMGIGPVMNEECEATDEVKHIRFVCISFLFSLIESPLWHVCCVSALLHHRHPNIISESKNDGKFN